MFFFQQSVEKICKAFGLFYHFISENKLGGGGIGHETHKIFENIIEGLDPYALERDICGLDLIPGKKQKFIQMKGRTNVSIEEINNLIEIMNNEFRDKEVLEDTENEFKKTIECLEAPIEFKESWIKLMSLIIKLIPFYSNSIILAYLTSPHAIKSRYPDKQTGNPIKFYTEDLPIIKALPNLLNIQERIIQDLELSTKNKELVFSESQHHK